MSNKMARVQKIKLVSIDGDGCLFAYKNVGSRFESSWDALGYAYGLKEVWDKRIEIYYKKGADDLKWARTDIADLKGRSMGEAGRVLYPVPYCRGAREFAGESKGRLFRGLLTTAIDLVAEKAAGELVLDFSFHNKLHRNNGIFTGTLDYDVPTWRKHEKIDEVCKRFGVAESEICHIGDNENDLSVAERVGMFIALKPKKESVKNRADYVADDFFDVIRILKIAGVK